MNPTRLSINEAASFAGVSRRTIYLWIKRGKLTCVRTAGGSIRIDAASLFRTADGDAIEPAAPVEARS